MFSADSINAEKLIDFMERLVKDAGRKVYLILDNLRVHHSEKASPWADTHNEQIALFYLPPYSPEYHPDEDLNYDLKQSIGSREQVKNVDELQSQESHFMSGLEEDKGHVKANFKHPALESYRKLDKD